MARLLEKLGEEPITLSEAKQQCYVDLYETDNDIVDALNRAVLGARRWAENYTWRGLVYGKYEHSLRGFPRAEFEIPYPPLHSIEQITYQTEDGEQSLSESAFYVDDSSEPGQIGPVSDWPHALDRPGSVKVTYIGGFKQAAGENDPEYVVIPDDIKSALLILVKFFFDHRDTLVPDRTVLLQLPVAVRALLDPYTLQRAV